MKRYNAEKYNAIVASRDIVLRHYCEWLFDAPTYGARIFDAVATGWNTAGNSTAAIDFPETYKMLERHFNNDPELAELREQLKVTDKEPLCRNIA